MIDSASKSGALCAKAVKSQQFNWVTAKHAPQLYTNKAFQSLAFRGRTPSVFSRPSTRSKIAVAGVTPTHKTYGAIILAPTEEGHIKYALVQGRYTGKWSFPKGHANEGEVPLACTLRELAEETGLETLPEPIEYIQVGYGNYHVFHLDHQPFLTPRDTNEIMDTKWVTLDEMRSLPLNADASMFAKRN